MIIKIKRDERGKSFYFFNKKLFRIGGSSITSLSKKIDTIDKFIKIFFSITQIPPATGLLRDIQKAQLQMLKEVDRICRLNNMSYWLEFGTLIGAVRHKGFIPWDDDIDICMMRDDYEKFIKIFNQQTKIPDLYAVRKSSPSGYYNCINIYHKKISLITTDIFPCDFLYKELDDDEKIIFSQKLKELNKSNKKNKSLLSTENFHASFIKIRDENIPETKPKNDVKKPAVFLGMEFLHKDHDYNVFDYDTIFPLQNISFEGCDFLTVNQPDIHLTYLYRDYMSMPKNIHFHHDINKLPMSDLITLKKFINGV